MLPIYTKQKKRITERRIKKPEGKTTFPQVVGCWWPEPNVVGVACRTDKEKQARYDIRYGK